MRPYHNIGDGKMLYAHRHRVSGRSKLQWSACMAWPGIDCTCNSLSKLVGEPIGHPKSGRWDVARRNITSLLHTCRGQSHLRKHISRGAKSFESIFHANGDSLRKQKIHGWPFSAHKGTDTNDIRQPRDRCVTHSRLLLVFLCLSEALLVHAWSRAFCR